MQFDRELDYYAVLQVADTASGVVIRAAHQVLAELYFDDRQKKSLVDQAYDVLSHPTRRQQYDSFRAGIKGRRPIGGDLEIAVLCPVCQSKNLLDPLKDNRAAICGVCRAKLAKDLIGKPIRTQARKNILAMVKRRMATMPKAYKDSLVIGLILIGIAGLGTASFFGFRARLDPAAVVQLRPLRQALLPGGPAAAPAAPAARQAQPPPAPLSLPVAAGMRVKQAAGALNRAGWTVTSQYDVAAQGGNQHVLEARRGATGVRLYFKGGKLAEAERF